MLSCSVNTQLIVHKCASVEFLEQKCRLIKDSDLWLQPDRCIISMLCCIYGNKLNEMLLALIISARSFLLVLT